MLVVLRLPSMGPSRSTETSMVPFQSAFLGKRSSENAVKNDGARRLERRLRRYRQSRTRSSLAAGTAAGSSRSRVAQGELDSHPLGACSHSELNSSSRQNRAAADPLEQLALEQPHDAEMLGTGPVEQTVSERGNGEARAENECPNQPGIQQNDPGTERCTHVIEDIDALAASDAGPGAECSVRSSAGGRKWAHRNDLVKYTQSEVADQLTKRGHQLCARMNALAATLNSQPIRHTASRSRSVPPLASGTSDAAVLGTDNAAALTRSGATMSLAPLRMPHAQRRTLPKGVARDRRPRRATVPVTNNGPGGNVRPGDGYRHQLAPLQIKGADEGHRPLARSLARNSEPSDSGRSTMNRDMNARNGNGNGLAPPLFDRRRW